MNSRADQLPQHRFTLPTVLAAFSLANLVFLDAWGEVLSTESYYYRQTYDVGLQVLALVMDIAVVSGFTLAGLIAAQSRRKLIRYAGIVCLVAFSATALNAIRHQTPETTAAQQWTGILALCLGAAVVIWRRMTLKFLFHRALLIVSPMFALSLVQGAAAALKYDTSYFTARNSQVAPKFARLNSTHIVWIVFDELDYEAAFLHRPPRLEMPAFDRLRNETFWATQAQSAGKWTMVAMPQLISGISVEDAFPKAPDDLHIERKDGQTAVTWSQMPSLFSRARKLQLNNAVIGWYHPYCRMFGADLVSCDSQASGGLPSRAFSLQESMKHHAKTALRTLPSLHRIASFNEALRQVETEKVKAQVREGTKAIVDPSLNLVFLHLAVPHPPGLYDRKNHVFSSAQNNSYLDNLVLADRILGEFRLALEKAGLWDDTTLIITSDHGWRFDSWKKEATWTAEDQSTLDFIRPTGDRVPFIVKMAGQANAVTYDANIKNAVGLELVLAIARREINTIEQLLPWLEQVP